MLACLFRPSFGPGRLYSHRRHSLYLDATGESPPVAAVPNPCLQGAIPIALQEALQAVLHPLGHAPSGWAVRSSAVAEDGATASFAGIYDSVLQVPENQLWEAIRSCWSSWWSDRAVAYRQRLGQGSMMKDDEPQMAV